MSLVCGRIWSQKKLGKESETPKRMERNWDLKVRMAENAFSYVAAIYIRRDKLESAVPLVNNGTTILCAGLIVKDL